MQGRLLFLQFWFFECNWLLRIDWRWSFSGLLFYGSRHWRAYIGCSLNAKTVLWLWSLARFWKLLLAWIVDGLFCGFWGFWMLRVEGGFCVIWNVGQFGWFWYGGLDVKRFFYLCDCVLWYTRLLFVAIALCVFYQIRMRVTESFLILFLFDTFHLMRTHTGHTWLYSFIHRPFILPIDIWMIFRLILFRLLWLFSLLIAYNLSQVGSLGFLLMSWCYLLGSLQLLHLLVKVWSEFSCLLI